MRCLSAEFGESPQHASPGLPGKTCQAFLRKKVTPVAFLPTLNNLQLFKEVNYFFKYVLEDLPHRSTSFLVKTFS
jgi:hypothetical protein